MNTCFPDQPRPALIQVPSPVPNGTKRTVQCMVHGMQGKRLTLQADEPLAVSSVVSVEYEDTMFLGEVVLCTKASAGGEDVWNVEIKVEQVLNGLQSLMALRARLLSEGIPQPIGAPHSGILN